QRLQPFEGFGIAEEQHHHGDTGHHQSPEDYHELGRVLAAAGGEDAHHHRGGVRGGDEEDRQDEHDQDRQPAGKGEVLHDGEQHLRRVDFFAETGFAVPEHRNRGSAHDPVSHDQQGGGDQDDPQEELADRAATGDACDKMPTNGDQEIHQAQ